MQPPKFPPHRFRFPSDSPSARCRAQAPTQWAQEPRRPRVEGLCGFPPPPLPSPALQKGGGVGWGGRGKQPPLQKGGGVGWGWGGKQPHFLCCFFGGDGDGGKRMNVSVWGDENPKKNQTWRGSFLGLSLEPVGMLWTNCKKSCRIWGSSLVFCQHAIICFQSYCSRGAATLEIRIPISMILPGSFNAFNRPCSYLVGPNP